MVIRTVVNKGIRVYLQIDKDNGESLTITFTPEEWEDLKAVVTNTESPFR